MHTLLPVLLAFSQVLRISSIKESNIKFYLNSELQCNNSWPFDGAVVYSHIRSTDYSNSHLCLVDFIADAPSERVLVQINRFSVTDCSDSLTLFDGSHTKAKAIVTLGCHRSSFGPFETNSTTVGLQFSTDAAGNNGGFEIILTGVFNNSCGSRPGQWFQCPQGYCIQRSLTCDEVPHCVGGADERQSEDYCYSDDASSSAATAAALSIVGGVILCGLILALACMFRRRKAPCCPEPSSVEEPKNAGVRRSAW